VSPLHFEYDRLQAYLDGTLADAEREQLEARLRDDSLLADALILLAREEAIMTEWVRSSAAAQAEAPSPAVSSPHRRRRKVVVAFAATAATIALLVLFISLMFRRSDTPGMGLALAMLEDVQGTVDVVGTDGAVQSALVGQPLYSGQEIRTGEEGSSTVVRVDDSRLLLGSETRVRLAPEAQLPNVAWPVVYVVEGIVGAEIAARSDGKALVLSGSHAEFRSEHGKYQFVSLPDTTVLETDDGLARFTRKRDGQSIVVPRGKSAVASPEVDVLQAQNLPARPLPRRTLQESAGVIGLQFDAESVLLTSCAGDFIRRWDLSSGKPVSTFRPQKQKRIRNFAVAPDGQMVALAFADDRMVRLFPSASGNERAAFRGMKKIAAIAFSADGRLLAVAWNSGKEGHEVRVYDTVLGIERVLHTGHNGPVQALVFSPKGSYLATAGERSVKIWDTAHFNLVRSASKLQYEPRVLAFSPDDKLLAWGNRKGMVHLFDASAGVERFTQEAHLREVATLAFSPDGLLLLSGGADGAARLWSVFDGRAITEFKSHSQTVSTAAFARDGRTLATGGPDRKIMLWDVPNLLVP